MTSCIKCGKPAKVDPCPACYKEMAAMRDLHTPHIGKPRRQKKRNLPPRGPRP